MESPINDRLCIVCGQDARHTLGIRCRYGRQRDALWAPDIGAYLCDEHAETGCHITIDYAPAKTGLVTVITRGPRGTAEAALEIGTRRKITPGQERLDW